MDAVKHRCKSNPGSVAAIVAVALKGEAEPMEVWWGGEGIGRKATHTHYCRFWTHPNYPVTVILPLTKDMWHQLRTPNKELHRWSWTGATDERSLPVTLGVSGRIIRVDHDPTLSKPVVQYDEATVGS